jgi:hypothetical protein
MALVQSQQLTGNGSGNSRAVVVFALDLVQKALSHAEKKR